MADTKFGDRERRKSLARVEEWSFIVNQPTADADDLVSWLQGDAKPVETQYLEQVVVLDMASPYVYIGRFVASDERYFVLEEADVHDLRDSTTTRNPQRARLFESMALASTENEFAPTAIKLSAFQPCKTCRRNPHRQISFRSGLAGDVPV
ncbi:MAG: hypothetical protein R3C01_17845 [Planctomycetaceae bacterium]